MRLELITSTLPVSRSSQMSQSPVANVCRLAFVFDGANIMHYSEIIAMFAKEFEKISYADI